MSIRIFLVIFGITLLTACGGGGGGRSNSASDRASLDPLLGIWSAPDFYDPDSTPKIEELYVSITSNGNVSAYIYAPTIGNCYTVIPTLFTLQGTSNGTYTVASGENSTEVEANFNNEGELSLDEVGESDPGPILLPTDLSLNDLNDLGECQSVALKGFSTPAIKTFSDK